jgi:hypothetical protein
MISIVFTIILLKIIFFRDLNYKWFNGGNCLCGGKFKLLHQSKIRKDYQCNICKMVVVRNF